MGMERFSRISVVVLCTFFILLSAVASVPVERKHHETLFGGAAPNDDKFPVMIPVSSTVIPLTHLFGRPKKNGGHTTKAPKRALFLSAERRARLLERSSRPDAPVRLITKNSRQKDINNETH